MSELGLQGALTAETSRWQVAVAACVSLELNGLVQDEASADWTNTVLAKWALHVGLQTEHSSVCCSHQKNKAKKLHSYQTQTKPNKATPHMQLL